MKVKENAQNKWLEMMKKSVVKPSNWRENTEKKYLCVCLLYEMVTN